MKQFCVCLYVCSKAMNYEDHPSSKMTDAYQDRAAERRRTVGSDSPGDQSAATQAASVHRYHHSPSLLLFSTLNLKDTFS